MNLFNELEFETFTQIAIKQAISKVHDADILNADLKEEAQRIIDSLTFTVPVIEKKNITSSLNLENASGHTYSDSSLSIENEDIFATATYKVPFIGNSEIFKVKPLDFENYSQEFKIENNNITFKIRTDSKTTHISEIWKNEIIKTSFETISYIESNLNKLESYFKQFKNEIIGPVIYSLNERKKELLDAKSVANELNIFNNTN